MQTPAKVIIGTCLAAGIFFAGYVSNRRGDPAAVSASAKQVLYYTCPMHPQYKLEKPGDCPSCGMRLEPVYASNGRAGGDSADLNLPGMVHVSAGTEQLAGVRTDEVRRSSASHLLSVPGRVTADDARLYRIIAGTDGWVRQLGQNSAGAFVKKNEILASYYAQNLLASTQTYVFALQTNAQVQRGDVSLGYQRTPTTLNLQVAIDTLRALGMSDLQIEDIRKTGVAPTEIYIYSPVTGFVLERNLSPGQRFDKGAEIYRVADISHVWVLVDVFEKDRQFLTPGMTATVRYQGHKLQARMSDVLPQLDPQTRTLRTRFELDNPGFVLLPDVFVTLDLNVSMPAAVTVPADAVIDSGRSKTVFVERGAGLFEPRLVETGWRLGDRVQITEGLHPGERIAVAGNFLLDSESRMRMVSEQGEEAASPQGRLVVDPVCGMKIDPAKAAGRIEYKGTTYYFCSEQCKKSFESSPEKHVPNGKG